MLKVRFLIGMGNAFVCVCLMSVVLSLLGCTTVRDIWQRENVLLWLSVVFRLLRC